MNMEKQYIAYKYRLQPTKEQANEFASIGGTCRFLWNYFLNKNKEEYALSKEYTDKGKFLFYSDMYPILQELKKEHDWLSTPPVWIPQQRLKDLSKAITAVFKSGFGFPKFKSKKNKNDSFRIPQSNGESKHIQFSKKAVCLPKIGWIRWIRHRPMTGKFKEITIKQEGTNWYAICVCQITPSSPISACYEDEILGIDLGLNSLLVCSDISDIDNPRWYRSQEQKLKKLQKQVSKKIKESNNRNKARFRLASAHRKIIQKRNDYLRKIVSVITKQYRVVGVEDLNISGMMKNRRLAKSIWDASWGKFISFLAEKVFVVKIDRYFPSTQICYSCDERHKVFLSERTYKCECGNERSRDLNAALNIQKEAIKIYGRTGVVRTRPSGQIAWGEPANYSMADPKDQVIGGYDSLSQEKFRSFDLEASSFRAG